MSQTVRDERVVPQPSFHPPDDHTHTNVCVILVCDNTACKHYHTTNFTSQDESVTSKFTHPLTFMLFSDDIIDRPSHQSPTPARPASKHRRHKQNTSTHLLAKPSVHQAGKQCPLQTNMYLVGHSLSLMAEIRLLERVSMFHIHDPLESRQACTRNPCVLCLPLCTQVSMVVVSVALSSLSGAYCTLFLYLVPSVASAALDFPLLPPAGHSLAPFAAHQASS